MSGIFTRPAIDNILNDGELTPEQRRVYQVLSFEHPLTMDEIIECLPDEEVSSLSCVLLQMEMEGLVVENELHAYRRAERE